jgi:DNA-binding response OmpR family regulator
LLNRSDATRQVIDVAEWTPTRRRMTESDTSTGRRALILIVERDPHVRELEAHFLLEAGFEIEFADDGAAALKRARAVRPDLVITEVLIPKLDGLALCRQLKAHPETQHTMVLIFSILASTVRAREAGADAFLLKPIQEQRLVETVRRLLAVREQAPTAETE